MAKKHHFHEPRVRLSLVILLVIAVAALSVATMVQYYKNTELHEDTAQQEQQNIALQSSQTQPGPQSFSGKLPCADCSGITTSLTLQKNSDDPSEGTFVMIQTYEGKGTQPVTTLGKWDVVRGTPLNKDAIVIKLKPSDGSVNQYWLVVDNDTLQMLDTQENLIKSPFSLQLKRTAS
jgi:uncharacterized lipoprotein NlpE involved in copper resistance